MDSSIEMPTLNGGFDTSNHTAEVSSFDFPQNSAAAATTSVATTSTGSDLSNDSVEANSAFVIREESLLKRVLKKNNGDLFAISLSKNVKLGVSTMTEKRETRSSKLKVQPQNEAASLNIKTEATTDHKKDSFTSKISPTVLSGPGSGVLNTEKKKITWKIHDWGTRTAFASLADQGQHI